MASHLSIKILVVGDENVGKTTIINYFTLVPIKMAASTVGIDFQSRMVALSSDIDGDEDSNKNIKEQQNIENTQNHPNPNTNPNNIINNRGYNHSHGSDESEHLLLITMKVNLGSGNGSVVRPKNYDHVKCCFWDTSGSPNYQCLAQTYYTGIAAVIVVFDLSNQTSYNNLNSYIIRVIQKNNCNHSHPILVLGNKLDKRSIHFTKKQVFEALCFDFPHEKITYREVSCIDKLDTLCEGCANSSDIHVTITSFLQSVYDSVIKPHYYNPLAITDIGCRGISGNTRFFKEKTGDASKKDRTWYWKGNYTKYIHGRGAGTNDDPHDDGKNSKSNNYIQMVNLKTPRECCNEHGLERVSSCTSGCSIM
jgi:small GTP-binding protein